MANYWQTKSGMSGHIQPRGPDSWRLHVFAGRDPETGKQRFVYRTVHGTKRDAERELRKLAVEVDEGKHSFARASFGDLCERWYEVASRG